MTPSELEQLLYESEGPTLDFKREQYLFAKASEEEKSEILKDILGFANCWRRSEAFIVIGVEDVQGGRGIVHGVLEHLHDHSLQQFVNNLTNRPVQFAYEAYEVFGRQVGVIRIDLQQRPLYLKRDYGKLRREAVYVRRGSSTDPTKPASLDEIATMGNGLALGREEPSLMVAFAALDRDECLGDQIDWSAENCELPPPEQIPKLRERGSEPIRLPGGGTIRLPDVAAAQRTDRLDPDYYHKLANYAATQRRVRKCRLVITNAGEVPAHDVRLEIDIPHGSGFDIIPVSELPQVPKHRTSIFDTPALGNIDLHSAFSRSGSVDIQKTDHATTVSVECGNLQPGRNVWTEDFPMVVNQSGQRTIEGRLYAEQLSRPRRFTLAINAVIANTQMTVAELTALAPPDDEEF